MDGQAKRWMDVGTDRWAGKQTDGLIQMKRYGYSWMDGWIPVQTVGQANEQTDGWITGTDGWTGEQASIQMDEYGYRGMDGQAN